ncbi:hypothetical protein FACS1894189_2210 [Planctomycetales bacterium]|nr:hypothetical protein FACS1894189_2210 [Planctomycetales bacterium]
MKTVAGVIYPQPVEVTNGELRAANVAHKLTTRYSLPAASVKTDFSVVIMIWLYRRKDNATVVEIWESRCLKKGEAKVKAEGKI